MQYFTQTHQVTIFWPDFWYPFLKIVQIARHKKGSTCVKEYAKLWHKMMSSTIFLQSKCVFGNMWVRKFILTRFLLINRGCAKKARERRGRRVGVVLAKKRPRKWVSDNVKKFSIIAAAVCHKRKRGPINLLFWCRDSNKGRTRSLLRLCGKRPLNQPCDRYSFRLDAKKYCAPENQP